MSDHIPDPGKMVSARDEAVERALMEDRVVATANSERWQAYYDGHNHALAAVRANAVKVEEV